MTMGNSTWKQALLMLVVVAVGYLPSPCEGTGRLMDPPSRSSLWREDSSSPTNYNDNMLSCGGFDNQWNTHDGKCGICGDPWQGPRDNEAGGQYANGIISRSYERGQAIDVDVELTAHQKGWFEFRICPNNDVSSPASQACLDQNLLPLVSPPGVTRYQLPEGSTSGLYTLMLELPEDLTCEQCVFQWIYNTGNSWGCEDDVCDVGNGPQAQFRGCADVSISDYSDTTTATSTTTTTTTAPATTPTQNSSGSGTCHSAGAYEGAAGMDAWCVTNCAAGNCPATHCACD